MTAPGPDELVGAMPAASSCCLAQAFKVTTGPGVPPFHHRYSVSSTLAVRAVSISPRLAISGISALAWLSKLGRPDQRTVIAAPPRRVPARTAIMASGPAQPHPDTRSVLIPIANGTEEMEAVILIDVLRRAGAFVTVASVEPQQLTVTASRGVKLVADKTMEEVAAAGAAYDLIVLPGGMPGAERLRDSSPLRNLVVQQAQAGRLYGAICAAPAVALGSWGLLEDKKATAHPAFTDKLPDKSTANSRVVHDGKLLTSRGPGTALEFSLALIEQLFGPEKAAAVAGPMVVRKGDGTDRFREVVGSIVWNSSSGPKPLVLVPVATSSEEIEAVVVIDVLVRAGAEVVLASVEDELQVVASRGVKIVADKLLSDCAGSAFDLIVLPGGMPGAQRLHDSPTLRQILSDHAAAGRPYAAICAAPAVVLEAQGLLQGRKATCHPNFADKLSNRSAVDVRVVIDGNVATSRGPGTAFEFALALVEKLFGPEKAVAVAGPMVMPPEPALVAGA